MRRPGYADANEHVGTGDRVLIEGGDRTVRAAVEAAAAKAEAIRQAQSALAAGLTDADAERPEWYAAITATVDAVDDLERQLSLALLRADELARVNAQLQTANEDLEQFAYVASHDLSEPLRSIAGPISLLARRYRGQLDVEADTYVAYAVDGCQRMQAIIDDLLRYCSVGQYDEPLRDVDLSQLVQHVLAGLRDSIEESGALVTFGQLPILHADAAQLSAVFENLISNALKFVAPGVAPRVDITAERVGDTWRFAVDDNGIGIDPAYRDRIFGIFKRLHPHEEYPGTGIGLAIVKKIVQRHGGSVGVTEAAGGGSRFWFTLKTETEQA